LKRRPQKVPPKPEVRGKRATGTWKLSARDAGRQSLEINLCITHAHPLMVNDVGKRVGVVLVVFQQITCRLYR